VGSESRDLNAWLSEMNAKIESTYQRYTNEIIDVQARMDALRARRAALASPPASGSE
jgi:chromosome condensin MukBEF MukE localization factor